MDAQSVEHIIIGPPGHGVTRYAERLHAALGEGPVRRAAALAELPATAAIASAAAAGEAASAATATAPEAATAQSVPSRGRGGMHISFTDHLFGTDPLAAAEAVEALAAGRRLSVSVHDVPQAGEGEERVARRRAGYRQLLACADVVIANSRTEAAALEAIGGPEAPVPAVVPLPIEDPRPLAQAPGPVGLQAARPLAAEPALQSTQSSGLQPARPQAAEPTIGIFGFVYPGKGCEDVIAAAPSGSRVRLLGAVAPGHADYLAALSAQAQARGIALECTGFLPDAQLAAALDAVDVPVCAHRHVSASGSLHTWLAHNRVPLVLDAAYMREIAARWPQHLRLIGRAELPAALRSALAEPASTWAQLPPPNWGWPEVAAAYRQVWEQL